VWALRVGPSHHWAQVALPWRPNGRTGWIRLDGRLRVHTAYWVRADLSARTVTLMKGRRPRIVFRAAIGAPSTPTPTGHFFVTDRVATGDPYGPFGWFAFGLSGHQPNLPAGWSGGDQLAIHGTNAPSSIGTAASAGCLRVSAAALSTLRGYLRLGTPVVIRR
jgi:lipoprotein-anchoring transpeptidase ErfK/SrfK